MTLLLFGFCGTFELYSTLIMDFRCVTGKIPILVAECNFVQL
jgi:hypothetical protein